MEKKLVAPSIDFADGEFKSFEMTENSKLIVYLKSWKEKNITLIFSSVIQFSYKLGDHLSNIYEISGSSHFLEEALEREYIKVPENHPFKLYQIHDISDFPYVEVVAERVEVIKE